MRKFTLVLFAALMASSASFAQTLKGAHEVSPARNHEYLMAKNTISAKDLLAQNALKSNKTSNGSLLRKVPESFGPLITEQPAGKLVDYQSWSSYGYYVYWFWVVSTAPTGMISKYVIGDDGNIYLYNPISSVLTDSWLKLEPQPDGTYYAAPQEIFQQYYEDEDSTYHYYVERLVLSADQSSFVEDSTDTPEYGVHFTYEDSVLSMVADNGVLGLVGEDGSWAGYCDYNIDVKPNHDVPVTLPEGLTPEDYVLTYYPTDTTTEKIFTKVAFDDNDVYVLNPYDTKSDEWFKGSFEDGKVVVPSNQFMGANDSIGYFLYLKTGLEFSEYDAENGEYYKDIDTLASISFDFDEATKTLTAPRADTTALIVNCGNDRIYYADYYVSPILSKYVKSTEKPAAPEFQKVSFEHEAESGYNYAVFTLPKEDIEGNYIDPAALTYKVMTKAKDATEAEDFVFYPDEYVYIDSEMVELPYGFSDSQGYDIYASGSSNTIYFYQDITGGYLGVAQFYAVDEDTKLSSDTTWVYVPTLEELADVKGVNASESNVKSVVYYDLSGRQLKGAPKQNGLFIREQTFADGSKKAVKVLGK